MLETYAVFAAVFFLALLVAIFRYYPASKRVSTVPGLNPSGDDGNFSDISKAGSLHEFLTELHAKYGPIASFWWGSQYTVSISSPELFKEHHHVFDRPPLLFKMFEPFTTEHSIQYANGDDGKSRRQDFDKVFDFEKLGIYYEQLQEIANEIAGKWSRVAPEDHLALGEQMFLFAVKAALVALMGDNFKNDKEALAFKHSYDVAWADMEKRLTDPAIPDENNPRGQAFKKAMTTLREIVSRTLKERKAHGMERRDYLLIDSIIDHHHEEDKRFADCITYLVGGFHTTGNLLTWAIYFLAENQDMQDRLHKEVVSVLGKTDVLTHSNIASIPYLRWVLDEALRCGVVAPYAARVMDEDSTLGGHIIPKGTPVIHALGVMLMDDKHWPDPDRFDPERFSPEGSRGRPTIAFSPYGFAGKRQCPGYRFAYVESSIMLAMIVQRFKVSLVPGQTVVREHGLVTHPKEEVWIRVAKRQ